jgi:hypothetical protein
MANISFEYLVSDSGEAARDAVSVHHDSHEVLGMSPSLRSLRAALKSEPKRITGAQGTSLRRTAYGLRRLWVCKSKVVRRTP